jgi:hypothetical protein
MYTFMYPLRSKEKRKCEGETIEARKITQFLQYLMTDCAHVNMA